MPKDSTVLFDQLYGWKMALDTGASKNILAFCRSAHYL